jgi:DNA-binding NtrC family response regulator
METVERIEPGGAADPRSQLTRPECFSRIITGDPKMLAAFSYLESIRNSPHQVLITGETGTGKELVARAVYDLGDYRGPFVAVNVAGLDDHMFSDTLFGHVRGAFTGADSSRSGLIEQASGGVLFLDEIGDLPPNSQIKLLRLLQEREYFPLGADEPRYADTRIVAATNEDLWNQHRAGKFRRDLNFRLRTHHVHLPPLRERKHDIEPLALHFIKEAARTLGKKEPTCPRELFTLLQSYAFPGNVRELQSMSFDAVSRHKSKIMSLDAFKAHMQNSRSEMDVPEEVACNTKELFSCIDTLPSIQEATRMLVKEALRRSQGNQSIAAGMLGITRQALNKRLRNLP